ncbi:ATP-binding protein [Zhihengliuella salsuginis]|uniref:ATP-binding protein n=1 Tax=Zhihengliuella salsuginis TaxID=578222 RepID=A0ABQ3GIZ0_9MICC|nr:SbcC/MukB-like Walker B domain-containing protein [Zhihengliuella salsuginis]GHD05726.1 ATP-binding protein [Zhihengliuella salsuginis]
MSTTIHPGQWRLERVELVNWGTFSGFHAIDVPRKGFLLTGESGSGKSSIVDAISAVLTSRGRARFNAAAADASTRSGDRTLLTYVRGAWRRGTDEATGEITSHFLRPKATWSGVLLRYADGSGSTQSLVKLFHVKTGGTAPADVKDVGLLSAGPISLPDLEPLAANGIKVRELKSAYPDANVETEHAKFERRFSRALGLSGDRATLLLHKTQSAKNLGSLDELFRKFMLDEPATFAKADAAVEQFTELSAAHEAVLRARRQVEHLAPLRTASHAYDAAERESESLSLLLGHLEDFTHRWRLDLTRDALREEEAALAERERALVTAADAEDSARRVVDEARAQVDRRGGQQLALLESRLANERDRLETVRRERAELDRKLEGVQMPRPADAAEFAELQHETRALTQSADAERGRIDESRQRAVGAAYEAGQRLADIDRVVKAMRGNQSNLNPDLLQARDVIAQETSIPIRSLPFAGELLEVRAEHADWTGAIERVLRPLSAVLLVPAAHEQAVVRAVDAAHLGTFLRYEIVPRTSSAPARPESEDSLVYRIEVADGPMRDWLLHRLSDRYDFACVETADDLARLRRGVTRAGQVKRGARSFEKDDRFRVDDRRRWVLGFDNGSKLDHFLDERKTVARELEVAHRAEAAITEQEALLQRRLFTAEEIARQAWERIDVDRATARVEDLDSSRATLLADDGDLRAAQHRLEQAAEAVGTAHRVHEQERNATAAATGRADNLERLVGDLESRPSDAVPEDTATALLAEFDAVKTRRATTHETIETDARKTQAALNSRRDAARTRLNELSLTMARIIAEFKTQWPDAAQDYSENVADRAGYLDVLEQLEADRLPEFEHRFFDMLRTQTQQNIAQLRELIQRAAREFRRRIAPINESLLCSPYSPGRFLQIRIEDARPPMAGDFLRDLNTVTTGALAPEEERSEAERRFEVLARLMRRLGSSDSADRSWRQQCLDVRTHVRFTAVEIDADGDVLDYYDSGQGRSGGQKQKLVVFCLAAALRYQLTQGEELPRYGSIVMDEAFDKADATFTRMALDIFTEFGFHMILATPLKLLRTLEDYVGGIALVTCRDSRDSRLSPVPFSEVREDRDGSDVHADATGEGAAADDDKPADDDSSDGERDAETLFDVGPHVL